SVGSRHPVRIQSTASVAHKAAGQREVATLVDCRDPMAEREDGKLLMAVIEGYFAAADYKPPRSQFYYRCEERVQVVFGACLQDVELPGKGACRRPPLSRPDFGIGISRVHEQGKQVRSGQQLVQDF